MPTNKTKRKRKRCSREKVKCWVCEKCGERKFYFGRKVPLHICPMAWVGKESK